MSGLSELGAALRAAIEAADGAAQSAEVARNDGTEALRLIESVGADSGSDLIKDAIAFMGTADEAIGEAQRLYHNAAEQLHQYLASRGL